MKNGIKIDALCELSEEKLTGLASFLGLDYRLLKGDDKNSKAQAISDYIDYQNLYKKVFEFINQKSIGISYNYGIYTSCVSVIETSLHEEYNDILIDKSKIHKTGRIISEFEKKLAEQDVFLAFIDKNYVHSKHCMYELCYFFTKYSENEINKRLIPIFFDDLNLSDNETMLEIMSFWKDELINFISSSDTLMKPDMIKIINRYVLIACSCHSILLKIRDISSLTISNSANVQQNDLIELKKIIREKNSLQLTT